MEREEERSGAREEYRRGGPPAGWKIDCHHGERGRKECCWGGAPPGRAAARGGRDVGAGERDEGIDR